MIDYVILAAPRTGSNHLCSKLTSTPGLICHYELFHRQQPYFARPNSPEILALTQSAAPALRDSSPVAFLERVKNATPDQLVGFKLFPHQSKIVSDYVLKSKGIKKIVLYRQNILANFASNEIAKATNCFAVLDRATSDPPTRSVQVQFDPEQYEEHEKHYLASYRDAISALTKYGQAHFFLSYELINSDVLFSALLSWIGCAAAPTNTQSAHQKTGSLDILSRFTNPNDVLAYLEARGLTAWRYDLAAEMP